MSRFNELLYKRKNLTANIFEEEELIELSKSMSEQELNGVDRTLLTYSNTGRLGEIFKLLDKLEKVLDNIKES